jgi:hypothetical protein
VFETTSYVVPPQVKPSRSARVEKGMSRHSSLRRALTSALAFVCFAAPVTSLFAQREVWSVQGDAAADMLGASLTYVPDVDGDNVVDLLVGAPGQVGAPGKAYLYSGATQSVLREFDGDTPIDLFGSLVADLGDVNGDGVRDFAVASPWRNRYVPGAPLGAIAIESGSGGLIRWITSSTAQVGLAMSWVGDVDGDGVRDLLYNEFTKSSSTYKVVLVSGATGATIRTHTKSTAANYGFALGRAGDVDADGTDDYMVCDGKKNVFTGKWTGNVSVYSGRTGSLLSSVADYATVVSPAGDVDGDGHADVALADPTTSTVGVVHVVSGATGTELYSLSGESSFGHSISTTSDLDHDGRPDLVIARASSDPFDPFDDQILIYVYSGAYGAFLGSYYNDAPPDTSVDQVDATADVNGDGVFDIAWGNQHYGNGAGKSGHVEIVSTDFSEAYSDFYGAQFQSEYGGSLTLVDDKDGDGWRDVVVTAPGGFDISGRSQVVFASGRDGHELSRFQPTNNVAAGDRQVVSVGDVDGDAIEDVAVSCSVDPRGGAYPPTKTVDLRSGADGALIATLNLPSWPGSLAAAVDEDGTPLLLVMAGGAYVYDLATNSVVTSYAVNGGDVACIGDVNGDGFVDWVVLAGSSVVVFSGGASPATLWSFTPTSKFETSKHVATSRDLDGDGNDDVLVSTLNGSAGKVRALSGTTGVEIFELGDPQSGDNFGSLLTSLGDVNRDGIPDFAVGAADYTGAGLHGAVFLYSGKTATELFRLDAYNVYGSAANLRWQDELRVDPDRTPDLLIGTWVSNYDRGEVDLFQLDDLYVQVDPRIPTVAKSATATTSGGPANNLVGLYAVDINGTLLDYFIAVGTFDSTGTYTVTDTVPSNFKGSTMTLRSYGVGFNGKLVDTQDQVVTFQ